MRTGVGENAFPFDAAPVWHPLYLAEDKLLGFVDAVSVEKTNLYTLLVGPPPFPVLTYPVVIEFIAHPATVGCGISAGMTVQVSVL